MAELDKTHRDALPAKEFGVELHERSWRELGKPSR